MFRRRRDTSRRPASSAWWPVAPDEDDPAPSRPTPGQAPPLPASDPFGGWAAFPPGSVDPTDAVLGQQDPTATWGAPAPVAGSPAAASGLASAAGPPTTTGPSPAPGQPPVTPGPAAAPGPPHQPTPSSAPGQEMPSWLPLLTHEENEQRFQPVPEDTGPFEEVGGEVGAEVGGRRPPRSRRRARRADAPARSPHATTSTSAPTSAPTSDEPTPAADVADQAGRLGPPRSPAADPGAEPHAEPVPDLDPNLVDAAFAAGATTWLDPVAPPHPMEAAALAGAFAADYLSWDEQAPERRGQVLAQYLPSDVVGNPALLGWSGKGRQRAEFALPGAVRPDGDGRVVVDVRVRVTPYRAVGQPAPPAPAGDLEVAGVPAVAPAPTARGWKSLDSYWVRLTVPVNRDQGRLVVDTWDEQLGDAAAPASDPAVPATPSDPATAEDLDDEPDEPAVDGPGDPAPRNAASPSASIRPGSSGRTGERGRPGAAEGPWGADR